MRQKIPGICALSDSADTSWAETEQLNEHTCFQKHKERYKLQVQYPEQLSL